MNDIHTNYSEMIDTIIGNLTTQSEEDTCIQLMEFFLQENYTLCCMLIAKVCQKEIFIQNPSLIINILLLFLSLTSIEPEPEVLSSSISIYGKKILESVL